MVHHVGHDCNDGLLEGNVVEQNQVPKFSPASDAPVHIHDHGHEHAFNSPRNSATLGKNVVSLCSSLGTSDKSEDVTIRDELRAHEHPGRDEPCAHEHLADESSLEHGHPQHHGLHLDGRLPARRHTDRFGNTFDDPYFDHHGDGNEEILPLVYEDEPILNTEDEVEIEVAADTGAVAHVASPKDLPGSVPVETPEDGRLRNFVAANNTPIKNYGKASVVLEQEDGKEINTDFNVADVSRPLHSVSTICDNEKEMLFTKHGAVVVPEGALSRFLGSIRALARYPRRGGLYVAKMKARKPRTANRPGFTRPGAKR